MKKDIFKKIINNSKNSRDLLFLDKLITYHDLYLNIKKIELFLKKKIPNKELICLCSSYSLDYISLIFASYLNNNPITFINPNASQDEKKHILKNSNARIFFYEKNFFYHKNFKKFKSYNYFLNKKIYNQSKKDFRMLIYTSGTTKKAKGVMLSTEAISSNVIAINNNINLKKSDSGIILSPPAYAMGISQVLSFLFVKSKFLFLNSGLRFPYKLKKLLLKYKISIVNLSISAFKIFSTTLKKNEKMNFVKLVMAGGMQFTKKDFIDYKSKFPKAQIINFYGCTENSPRISHYKIKSKNNYKGIFPVGKSLQGVKIKIVSKDTEKKSIGKIMISGKSMMKGYYNLNTLTSKKIINGWFDTGDLGFFDKKNNLYLVGRGDNTFRVGHEKLCPEELESEIKEKFKIKEMVVSKIKDKILKWSPVCVVLKKDKRKLNDVTVRKLQDIFSAYKIPKKIIYFNSLPKTNYGKINRVVIQKILNEK